MKLVVTSGPALNLTPAIPPKPNEATEAIISTSGFIMSCTNLKIPKVIDNNVENITLAKISFFDSGQILLNKNEV